MRVVRALCLIVSPLQGLDMGETAYKKLLVALLVGHFQSDSGNEFMKVRTLPDFQSLTQNNGLNICSLALALTVVQFPFSILPPFHFVHNYAASYL